MLKRYCFNLIKFILILSVSSCFSSKELTDSPLYKSGYHKGTILILQMPCYYFEYPGQDQLKPIDGRYIVSDFTYDEFLSGKATGDDVKFIKGVLPIGTKIKFDGAYAESGYMVDTHTRYYAKIIEGAFKGRKVGIGALISYKLGYDDEVIETNKYIKRQ